MILSGILGAAILAIIATIIIYASSHHANKARMKKLRDSTAPTLFGNNEIVRKFDNTINTGIKCSNCGNITGTSNSFCPHCGSKLK